MDTNFETTNSTAPAPTAGAAQEMVVEAPQARIEPETSGAAEGTIYEEDFAREAEAIMEIPGAPHIKLEALAAGDVQGATAPRREMPKGKISEKEASGEDSLEEKILKLQQLVLTNMLMQMEKREKNPINNKELLEKIKKLIEEANDSKEGKPEIMAALMNLLFMAVTIAEKGGREIEQQFSKD